MQNLMQMRRVDTRGVPGIQNGRDTTADVTGSISTSRSTTEMRNLVFIEAGRCDKVKSRRHAGPRDIADHTNT